MFGGYDGTSFYNTVYKAAIANNAFLTASNWTNIGTLPAGTPEYFQNFAVIGDNLYFFGGFNGASWVNTIWSASVQTPLSWTQVDVGSPPANRSAGLGAVAVYNGRVYLFGGITTSGSTYTNTIYSASLSQISDNANSSGNGWTQSGTIQVGGVNTPLAYENLVLINGTAYLMGGFTGSVWKANIEHAAMSSLNSWTTDSATAGIAASGAPVIIGNTAYVFGGVNSGGSWVNTISTATVATSSNSFWAYQYPSWLTDNSNNAGITWPLVQNTTFTLNSTLTAGGATSTAASVTVQTPVVTSLSLTSPVNAGTPSTATWSSSGIEGGTCSVTQTDPASVTTMLSPMGTGVGDSNAGLSTGALSQNGTYSYRLACVSPYVSGGNNGTLQGSPTTGVAGKQGQALTLDGSTQYVDMGNPAALQLTTGTISAWIKTSGAGVSYRAIADKTNAYGMFLQDNVFGIYDWGGGAWRSAGVTPNDGAWHHVACSFQSGVANGTLCYLDGVLKLTTTMTVLDQTHGFQIGENYPPSTTQFFNGTIDDVRVYNRALSASEISTLTNLGQVTTGLVGYWTFNNVDISGSTAYDSSGTISTKTQNVVVNAASLPTISSFTSGKARKGGNAVLYWTITNMTSAITCNILPIPLTGQIAWNNQVTWQGTATTSVISKPTNYTLSCGNGLSTTTSTTVVNLVPGIIEI